MIRRSSEYIYNFIRQIRSYCTNILFLRKKLKPKKIIAQAGIYLGLLGVFLTVYYGYPAITKKAFETKTQQLNDQNKQSQEIISQLKNDLINSSNELSRLRSTIDMMVNLEADDQRLMESIPEDIDSQYWREAIDKFLLLKRKYPRYFNKIETEPNDSNRLGLEVTNQVEQIAKEYILAKSKFGQESREIHMDGYTAWWGYEQRIISTPEGDFIALYFTEGSSAFLNLAIFDLNSDEPINLFDDKGIWFKASPTFRNNKVYLTKSTMNPDNYKLIFWKGKFIPKRLERFFGYKPSGKLHVLKIDFKIKDGDIDFEKRVDLKILFDNKLIDYKSTHINICDNEVFIIDSTFSNSDESVPDPDYDYNPSPAIESIFEDSPAFFNDGYKKLFFKEVGKQAIELNLYFFRWRTPVGPFTLKFNVSPCEK